MSADVMTERTDSVETYGGRDEKRRPMSRWVKLPASKRPKSIPAGRFV